MILFKDINFSHILYTGIIAVFTVISLTGCMVNGQSRKTGDIDLTQTNIYDTIDMESHYYAELYTIAAQIPDEFREWTIEELGETIVATDLFWEEWEEIRYRFISLTNTNFPFVDDIGFEYLKKTYLEIDFSQRFEPFDEKYRDIFLSSFYRLLTGKAALLPPRKSYYHILTKTNEAFLNEIITNFNVCETRYALFNFSGNGYPDLGIFFEKFLYVIQYLPREDKFILWYTVSPGSTLLTGTRRVSIGSTSHPTHTAYIILDSYAGVETRINFHAEAYTSKNGEDSYTIFVSFPYPLNNTFHNYPLKSQSIIFSEGSTVFLNHPYFRITSEQHNILIEELQRSRLQGLSGVNPNYELTYSFFDLFGGFIN